MGKRTLQWVPADQFSVRIKNTRTGKVAVLRPDARFDGTPRLVQAAGQGREPGHGREAGDGQLEAIARKIAAMPERGGCHRDGGSGDEKVTPGPQRRQTKDNRMEPKAHIWQSEELAKLFLEDVRGAIPLATEQIDVFLRVVRAILPNVERFLDLGCGDGILGRAVLDAYPAAAGVFLDFSAPMIEAAKKAAAAEGRRAALVVSGFRPPGPGLIR